MQMRVGFALLCACWMGMADAQSAPPTWMATDGAADYHVEGAGDPWNKPGATLHIASVAEDAGKSGAVGSASDAMPFRNRKIKLEADLSTQGAEKGATLYLTVYGPRGKLDFISTGRLPVRDNQQQVHRAIELAVPSIATRLLYGLAISGQGTASAEHLRLLPGDTVKEVPRRRKQGPSVLGEMQVAGSRLRRDDDPSSVTANGTIFPRTAVRFRGNDGLV